MMSGTGEGAPARSLPDTLARRIGETVHRSPLRVRAARLGLRDRWGLLALAVRRGARHLAAISPAREVADPGVEVLGNEELVTLLLGGGNTFEPFLIRAAGAARDGAAFEPMITTDETPMSMVQLQPWK